MKNEEIVKSETNMCLVVEPSSGPYKFRCLRCDYISATKQSLVEHILIHMGIYRFKCTKNKCNYKTNRISCIKRHLDFVHVRRNKELIKCYECGFRVQKESELLEHLEMHEAELKSKEYQCHFCPFRTSVKGDMANHVRAHFDLKKYYRCDLCCYSSCSEQLLDIHLSKHADLFDHKKPELPENTQPNIKPINKLRTISTRQTGCYQINKDVVQTYDSGLKLFQQCLVKLEKIPPTVNLPDNLASITVSMHDDLRPETMDESPSSPFVDVDDCSSPMDFSPCSPIPDEDDSSSSVDIDDNLGRTIEHRIASPILDLKSLVQNIRKDITFYDHNYSLLHADLSVALQDPVKTNSVDQNLRSNQHDAPVTSNSTEPVLPNAPSNSIIIDQNDAPVISNSIEPVQPDVPFASNPVETDQPDLPFSSNSIEPDHDDAAFLSNSIETDQPIPPITSNSIKPHQPDACITSNSIEPGQPHIPFLSNPIELDLNVKQNDHNLILRSCTVEQNWPFQFNIIDLCWPEISSSGISFKPKVVDEVESILPD